MKLYLISNNSVLENITYNTDETLEQKRVNRPLSIEGEKLAKKLAGELDVSAIYSSNYASALASAKYLSESNNLTIYIDSNLRDAKIGELGKRNIKMLRYMQERDFNYKFINGESLNETKSRMKQTVNEIIAENNGINIAIFTHKRAIMSYLLDYTEHGFNLDDRLILSFNDAVVMDDAEKDIDVIELEINDGNITNIISLNE